MLFSSKGFLLCHGLLSLALLPFPSSSRTNGRLRLGALYKKNQGRTSAWVLQEMQACPFDTLDIAKSCQGPVESPGPLGDYPRGFPSPMGRFFLCLGFP